MEGTILTLGQAALLLASVVAVLFMVYVAVWLSATIVRLVRKLGSLDRPEGRPTIYRPGVGGVRGSARKW